MKKKTAAVLTAVLIAVIAAAAVLGACTSATVTLVLDGGIYNGSDENVVLSVSGGELDLGEYLPQKDGAQISGWTDEDGNFYGAHSLITATDGLTLTAVFEGVLEYTRVDGGYSVSATPGFKGVNVVIPAQVDGIDVVEVAENAFKDCTSVKTLLIPDSVKSIGRGALAGCTSLESLITPFAGASADITDQSNMGMSYVFGSSGGSSWSGHYPALTAISVTDAATSIPQGAFENMKNLQTVNLGANITSIGGSAFSGCTSLKKIVLPEKCASIGAHAFRGCTAAEITVNGAITQLGGSAFFSAGVIKQITLGEGLTVIPLNCFVGSGLEKITFSSTVTTVQSSAFRDCTRLTDVTVSSAVTLNSSAFSGCGRLENSGLHFSANGKFVLAEGAENVFEGTKVDTDALFNA